MGCGGRRNSFDRLRGCGGYHRPYFDADPVYTDNYDSRQQQTESPVHTGLFSKELSQLLDAKKTMTKLKEGLQSQIELLQNKISAMDKEIRTVLPVNENLAQKLLENKFDWQEKLTDYNSKLSRLEQEELDVDTLVQEIQLKRLDHQASDTNARIKELKLRLTKSDFNKA